MNRIASAARAVLMRKIRVTRRGDHAGLHISLYAVVADPVTVKEGTELLVLLGHLPGGQLDFCRGFDTLKFT